MKTHIAGLSITIIATILLIGCSSPTGGSGGGTIESQMVAYYPFTGNAQDASGNGHHGVINGPTAVVDRFDAPNRAYSFDGENDYIDLGTTDAMKFTGSFSISLWVRFRNFDYSSTGFIFSNQDSGTDPYYAYTIGITSTYLRLNLRNTAKLNQLLFIDVSTLNTTDWFFITMTYDHTTRILKGYIDGDMTGQRSITGELVNVGCFRTTIGAGFSSVSGHCGFFDGEIDDIRIYSRVLSGTEISSLFSETSGEE